MTISLLNHQLVPHIINSSDFYRELKSVSLLASAPLPSAAHCVFFLKVFSSLFLKISDILEELKFHLCSAKINTHIFCVSASVKAPSCLSRWTNSDYLGSIMNEFVFSPADFLKIQLKCVQNLYGNLATKLTYLKYLKENRGSGLHLD